MAKETIKAWVTKYALTQGILHVQGEIDHDISSDMFRYPTGSYIQTYCHGNSWHRTKEGAIDRAERMRLDKIAALGRDTAHKLMIHL